MATDALRTKPRTSPIRVWIPAATVPDRLRADSARLLVNGEVDVDLVCGMSCVTACYRCPWHDDAHIGSWSLLWVVRNDSGCWVEAKGVRSNRSQPVGTAVLLKIRDQHRLNCRSDAHKRGDGSWVAVSWDFRTKPTPTECERLIEDAASKAKAFKDQ